MKVGPAEINECVGLGTAAEFVGADLTVAVEIQIKWSSDDTGGTVWRCRRQNRLAAAQALCC